MAGDGFDMGELYGVARSFHAAAGALPGQVQAAVTETLADIVTDAKALTPVDTGFNRDSIDYDVTYSTGGAHGTAGPTSHYGGYLENGTSRMAPRPYMAPAFNANVTELQARLAGLL